MSPRNKFKIGDIVSVTPVAWDTFNEFSGRVDKFRAESLITVVDAEDDAFDVYPWQLSKDELEIKLFLHTTDGGAQYLVDNDNFALAKIIIRLDGGTKLYKCKIDTMSE